MTDWDTYYKVHMSRPPRDLLVKAVALCKEKDIALDLGAGTLVESNYLIKSGFNKVVAIDSSEEVTTFAKGLNENRLEVKISQFKDLTLEPETYDLTTAQYALPFYGKEGFSEFMAKIVSSLKQEGVFVGQLFGERDGWNGTKDMAFQSKDEALELLKKLIVPDGQLVIF